MIEVCNPPKHIAIIMDGNRRWAESLGRPAWEGHKQGAAVIKKVAKHCASIGVQYLTLYAFSTENWKREKEEINAILELLDDYLSANLSWLDDSNISLKFIGNLAKFPEMLQGKLRNIEQKSNKPSACMFLTIALSYGGRDEIRNAAFAMSKHIIDNQLDIDQLYQNNASFFDQFLETCNIPSPDILIRTGGMLRISNFLLWHIAYTELFFLAKYWPEIEEEDINSAINELYKRNRNYGR